MAAEEQLQQLKSHLEGELAACCRDHPIRDVIARLDGLPAVIGLEEPLDVVRMTARAIAAEHGEAMAGKYCKLVVLTLFSDLPARIARIRCPQAIRDSYPQAIRAAVETMRTMADAAYLADVNFFLKDLRLASQLSLPYGPQAVDFRVRLPKSFYRNNGLPANLSALSFITTRLGGLGPLLRAHTDARNLSDFNERGRIAFYLRVAELLDLHPHIRGIVGTSWYFDPQIAAISPHLGYLRKLPQDNGAYLRRDGESEKTTAFATAKSRTRRTLYEEGRYRPCSYTLVWARRDLLRWARKQA